MTAMRKSLPEAGAPYITVFANTRNLPQSPTEVSRLSELQREIEQRSVEGGLPCTAAFAIAERLNVRPGEVREQADRSDVRIVYCQLGLFGYVTFGSKRFVTPLAQVADQLATALREACVDGALPCAAAWRIAESEGLPRPVVGSAVETLEIRIAPCQLGCF